MRKRFTDDESGQWMMTELLFFFSLKNSHRQRAAANGRTEAIGSRRRIKQYACCTLSLGSKVSFRSAGSQSPSSVAPPPRPSKINRRNEHGETIVHIAARKGDPKQLKKVLKAGANVNEADNAGMKEHSSFTMTSCVCCRVNIFTWR